MSRAGRSAPCSRRCRSDGRDKHLGNFATAEEAALAVARFLGPEGVTAALAPEATPMTAAKAYAGGAEGLALVRADNSSGFKNVCCYTNGTGKLFQAK